MQGSRPPDEPEDTALSDGALLQRMADAAGAAILPHFRNLANVENKGGASFDPVTEADRAAEAEIRRILAAQRPDDGILGEEFAAKPSRNGRTWIVDPIDGTRGFMMGLPTWGVLLALSEEGRVREGLMAQPFVGERFFTDGGLAHHGRGERTTSIRCRPCPSLAAATVATTSPFLFDPARRARYERIAERALTVRFGTDCYAYALLAAGHIDVVIEAGLKAVDIAPFLALVPAAGGAITDWSGAPLEGTTIVGDYNGEALAVGDPSLLPSLLTLLAD